VYYLRNPKCAVRTRLKVDFFTKFVYLLKFYEGLVLMRYFAQKNLKIKMAEIFKMTTRDLDLKD
jgi:hypothetical protein